MDHQPFFKRGPSLLARLTFFGLLSIFLLVVDAQFHQLVLLRQGLGLMLHPLQRIASSPMALWQRAGEFFVTQSQLADENALLKQRQLTDAEQVQRNQALQAENDYLRRLLGMKEKFGSSALAVEVISAGRDPFSRRIVVDKGNSEVQLGQAVVDETGLVGQVTRVQILSSEVTLITDKGEAVPVEVVRNGLRAIAFGHGQDNMLELAFMPVNMDIQNGDQLVTSGIDGTYPRGLPVAMVTQIERGAANPFAKITCTPSAGVGRHRNLLIVSNTRLALSPPTKATTKGGPK
jgi:rod shape-determining protein MreC